MPTLTCSIPALSGEHHARLFNSSKPEDRLKEDPSTLHFVTGTDLPGGTKNTRLEAGVHGIEVSSDRIGDFGL